MAGFMAGFGQAFGQLPDIIQKDEVIQQNRIAAKRAEQLAAKKATGELITQYASAIESLPEDQIAFRTNLLFNQIEQTTGQKVNPAVAKIINANPQDAAKVMKQLYGDQGGFTMEALGKVLGDPTIFAGVYDAHNRRNKAIEAGAAFKRGLSAKTPQDALQAMGDIDPSTGGFKERLGGLQAASEGVRKGQEFEATNPLAMAALRHGIDLRKASPQARQFLQQELIGQAGALKGAEKAGEVSATPIPLEAAQLTQQPFGTTYGNLGAGGTPASATPAAQPPTSGEGTPTANLEAARRELASIIREMPNVDDPRSRALLEQQVQELRDYISRGGVGSSTNMPDVTTTPGAFSSTQPQAQPARNSLVPPTAANLAQQKAMAEGAAGVFNKMRSDSVAASKAESQMRVLGSLLSKVDTGSLAPISLSFQKALQSAGFDISDKASYSEAARSLAIHLLGNARTEAGGVGATSNYENIVYQQAIPNIDKLPKANQILVEAAIKQHKRTQEIYKEVAKYVQKNGYDEVAVTDIIEKYKDAHPTLTPEDAKYLTSGGAKKDTRPPLNSFFK